MLTILGLAVWLVVGLAPGTPIGRPLKRALVDWPAQRLSRVRPGVVLLVLLLTAASVALIAVAKLDGAFLVAQGLPEALGALAAFDVATYLDMLAIGGLFAASVRLRAVKAVVRSVVARLRVTRRAAPLARAARSRPAAPPPANSDDEGWPGFALAA
ncbi:MAG: hypothetical protein JWP49_2712 [Phenylobacterium sp.]|nr:hypothetical protein [Phenylobacterium sp.]